MSTDPETAAAESIPAPPPGLPAAAVPVAATPAAAGSRTEVPPGPAPSGHPAADEAAAGPGGARMGVTELRGLALLDAAIAQIQAHPETWNQQVYRYGRAMCVAGWVAHLAGGEWLTGPEGDADLLVAEPDDYPKAVYQHGGVAVIEADSRACRLLGITDGQADGLFMGSLRLADIRRTRDEIAAAVSS